MDKIKVAKELAAIAKDLMAIDFSTQNALETYLKEHPSANPANHHVKKTENRERDRVYDIHHASEKVATSIGSDIELLRDAKNKNGEFKTGERLKITGYSNKYPWTVRTETADGRKISFLVEGAWKNLRGFPKPPSMNTVEKWHENGISRSIDGQKVEPDGFSPNGAPSWCLVLGLI